MTALLLVHGRSQEMARGADPTYPHSIADYLSDPDVAGPIGDVLAH